jgi:hypothetical protein
MLKNILTVARLTLLLGLIVVSHWVNAAEVKLAVLQAAAPGGANLQILDRPEPQFLQVPAASLTWSLRPAEPLTASTRPDNRVIELYTGTPTGLTLLCRIFVRYYPSRAGWLPYFQLNEEPLLIRVNGRWQPIELMPGTPALIAQKGNTIPTPEGFFPSLEFGLTVGALPIAGWQVR